MSSFFPSPHWIGLRTFGQIPRRPASPLPWRAGKLRNSARAAFTGDNAGNGGLSSLFSVFFVSSCRFLWPGADCRSFRQDLRKITKCTKRVRSPYALPVSSPVGGAYVCVALAGLDHLSVSVLLWNTSDSERTNEWKALSLEAHLL